MMETHTKTKMQALLDIGQSVWLDYLHRRMTRSGELRALIEAGLRGMTSNPTIFEHAIASGSDYDDEVTGAGAARTDREIFEAIAIEDVREAADQFRGVFDSTDGRDGFVSIEISPALARDAEGSAAEARRLWKAVDRPNVMIKIPGTREGWGAIESCLSEGININITLLFSVEHYRAVAEAYLRALEARIARGLSIGKLASVASVFVSRVDTEVDKRIAARGDSLGGLRGKVAIASARLAYATFLEITQSSRWRALEAKGARKQRLLWASTGTKNPDYSDVVYVESLIGPDTIVTVPPETLKLFEDHGMIAPTLERDQIREARRVLDQLANGGIEFRDVNHTLEDEGIEKFAKSFDKLLCVIADKRNAAFVRARALEPAPES
jgi:transaldolase